MPDTGVLFVMTKEDDQTRERPGELLKSYSGEDA